MKVASDFIHINSWLQCVKVTEQFREENFADPDAPWMVDVAQPKLTLLLAFLKIHEKCLSLEDNTMEIDQSGDVR